MSPADARFRELLSSRLTEAESATLPPLTDTVARTLIQRIDGVRLFGHAYALLSNLTYGSFGPDDVLDFANRHELTGVCIHLLDGEERSLGQMSDERLREFAARARNLDLEVHLEISTTLEPDVDEVVRIAGVMGVRQIRVYSRFEGRLSQVMDRVEQDLRRLARLADQHDLHFSFEQHEELKATEIAELLQRVNHPRLHAMFDFGNMINACERPLEAFNALAPHILQAHLKGVHILPEGDGFGHRGVLQGSAEDDLPGARLLFELLMLGAEEPQVIALALEQENLYYAPAFRHANEEPDPFIPYRDLSTTGIPDGWTLPDLLAAEPGWADDQAAHVKGLLTTLRDIAVAHLESTDSLAGAR
ncbi:MULTISPECIES: TIM barrel protein [Arthrobacter]|uniref:TIM barrel protein n=2 Tax=Arthrobacter TaxID=1663 RepID=A0ABU9KNQ0_9MICC|nr:TIM barrel protein [Arthrobacter sp. YJM1]MDP5228529.1 TIM barrel protein [Arthrobacter sp. YJM1]